MARHRSPTSSGATGGTVYLVHFQQPIGSPKHQAQHYLAFTPGSVQARLEVHLAGQGARILAYVAGAGISVQVVRTWAGGRQLERQLKQRGHGPQLCPVCGGTGWQRRAAKQLSRAAAPHQGRGPLFFASPVAVVR